MQYDITKEYINIIRSRIKVGEYKNAIQSVDKLLAYDSSLPVAYYLKGICNYATGKYADSIRDYDHAIELNKRFAKAFFNRGVAKYRLKDSLDAINDMQFAYEIFTEDNDVISARKCVESIDIIKQEGM